MQFGFSPESFTWYIFQSKNVFHYLNFVCMCVQTSILLAIAYHVALHQNSNYVLKVNFNRVHSAYDAFVQSLSCAIALRECKQVAQNCFMFVNIHIKTNHTTEPTYIKWNALRMREDTETMRIGAWALASFFLSFFLTFRTMCFKVETIFSHLSKWTVGIASEKDTTQSKWQRYCTRYWWKLREKGNKRD